MKHARKLLLTAFCAIPLLADVAPKQGAVAFRFDDNQPVENWRAIHETFKKHQVPFSLAVVSGRLNGNQEQVQLLQAIAANGNEIMDHSPSHSSMKIIFANVAEAAQYQKHPGVERIENNVVLLKLVFDPKYGHNHKLTVTVKDKKLVNPDANVKKKLNGLDFLVFPDGRIYGVQKKGDEYSLCSPYDTVCDVADAENIQVIRTDRFGLQPTDDAMRLLAVVSLDHFKKLQLPTPKTFIIPGGWGVFPKAPLLSRIHGAEFGYKNGDSFNWWSGVYARPNGKEERFKQSPNWDSLERKTVEEAKKQIADLVAKHRVVVFISHFWTNNIPGGREELLRRNDALLSWLKSKQVPVLTMAQCGELLFDRPAAPGFELMPPLDVDLDEDKIPDGYELGAGTTVGNKELRRAEPGIFFTIRKLSGIEAGKNTFSCQVDAPVGSVVTVKVGICGDNNPNVVQQLPEFRFTVKTPGETLCYTFNVPAWSPVLDLSCAIAGHGPFTLRGLSLKAQQ